MRLRRGTFKYTLSVVFITNSGVRIQSKFKTYFNPCIDFRVELFKWPWTFTFAHTQKMTLGTHAHCAQWEHYDFVMKKQSLTIITGHFHMIRFLSTTIAQCFTPLHKVTYICLCAILLIWNTWKFFSLLCSLTVCVTGKVWPEPCRKKVLALSSVGFVLLMLKAFPLKTLK